MEAKQEGLGVIARMASEGLTAEVSLTKTQSSVGCRVSGILWEQQAGQHGQGAMVGVREAELGTER